MPILYSSILKSVEGIVHGFSIGHNDLVSLLKARGIQKHFAFETDQVHGKRVHVLTDKRGGTVLHGDAFITDRPGIICHVRTADCVPILIADKRNRAVAAVHAGWRGTSLNVVGKAIEEMKLSFGTDPTDCIAAIGPRICGDCYEVGSDVIFELQKLNIDDEWRSGDSCVDLGKANELLLKKAGVQNKKIDILSHCTCCDPRFTSWRRDRNAKARQINFIMIDIQ